MMARTNEGLLVIGKDVDGSWTVRESAGALPPTLRRTSSETSARRRFTV
jgi:hypothetical protein